MSHLLESSILSNIYINRNFLAVENYPKNPFFLLHANSNLLLYRSRYPPLICVPPEPVNANGKMIRKKIKIHSLKMEPTK